MNTRREMEAMARRLVAEHFDKAVSDILIHGSRKVKRQMLNMLKTRGWTDSDEIPEDESIEEFVRKAKARMLADKSRPE